ncbi:MAG: glycosyltransferase family 4 protein [Pseudomonadota bacterium]
MHVVFMSSLLPVAQPASGFDIANRVILDALRDQDIRVSMLGYASPGIELAEADGRVVLGEQEITNARASSQAKIRWLARALAHRTTFSSAKMLACGERAFVQGLSDLSPFDGLVLNSVQLPGAFLQTVSSYPSVYVAHNVEAKSALENARNSDGPLERLLFAREARLLQRLEGALCGRSAFVWTLSEEDRKALTGADDSRSATLPLVTRFGAPAQLPGQRKIEFDVGLIGSWSWRPNRIGLEWFLDRVAPGLPPTWRIAVAGNLDGPAPRNEHPGITFVGRVRDAATFLRSCAVIPLASTAGTGVQLKAIEVFEAGLPSVATSQAVRGIAQVPENCTIANESADFASALISKVEMVRQGTETSLDGRLFHKNQKQSLAAAIERGVNAISRNTARKGHGTYDYAHIGTKDNQISTL